MSSIAGSTRSRTVQGMISSPKRQLRRKRRGAQLLEFAITLPLFLMMLLFSLDLGRIVFLSGVLHDATFTSARAGAQVGGAKTGVAGNTDVSRKAYEEAMRAIPGTQQTSGTFNVRTGATCSRTPGNTNNYVTVEATRTVSFITPGLNSMLGMFQDSKGGYQLRATGVARCEVAK